MQPLMLQSRRTEIRRRRRERGKKTGCLLSAVGRKTLGITIAGGLCGAKTRKTREKTVRCE